MPRAEVDAAADRGGKEARAAVSSPSLSLTDYKGDGTHGDGAASIGAGGCWMGSCCVLGA